FKKRTGLNAMTDLKLGDFSDPNFRRWADFRIATITEFMKEIDHNLKSVNPQAVTIAEIYPGIEFAAVRVGSDVYQLYDAIDLVAHEYQWGKGDNAARKTPLDWLHWMIGMYSFRSFAGQKPTWMLSYSWDGEKGVSPGEEMQNLFASQLVAGTNCWDVHGHVMSGSNDIAMRKEIFGWIEQHQGTFYEPRTAIQPVGVYFSPRTRDYFCKEFLDSYLGLMSLLMHSHREFQIVTPRTVEDFHGTILTLPDARCLSNRELAAIESYAKSGGKLIITGQTAHCDETGLARETNPLQRFLGIRNSSKKSMGSSGLTYAYLPVCPGKAYWKALNAEFIKASAQGVASGQSFQLLQEEFDKNVIKALGYSGPVQVEASPFITSQTTRVNGRIHIFLANFKGLQARKVAKQIPERNVAVTFPANAGSAAFVLPFLGKPRRLPIEPSDGQLRVVVPRIDKAAVVWLE
ncbi:MAG: hypothetical protein ACREIC_22130, partial [Limisphaerales bacterium]